MLFETKSQYSPGYLQILPFPALFEKKNAWIKGMNYSAWKNFMSNYQKYELVIIILWIKNSTLIVTERFLKIKPYVAQGGFVHTI